MTNIALPKKISFADGEKPNQKMIIIEPLFPGYGTTVGNSLRRVLLSSLPGTAVVGVKIKGADHEFMALPNVKEDILTIALNLKQLHLKVHNDEIVRLELEAHGEKEVKASDIKANSDIEIMNPDLVIAHLTDMAGKLEMEIFVSKGFGYETIENREERQKEIGYIEIDSIFSPVMSVGVNIENTRVGKMTDWDRLTLDIVTNGVITPEQAFEDSVKILVEQFKTLSSKLDEEEAPVKEKQVEADNSNEDNKKDSEEVVTKTETSEEFDELNKLKRDKLNAMAVEKGIADADKMKKKSDVIEAIINN
ncbi:MAG: DNA-directed RNA polymerase subunit alpha [bacterium]